MTGVRRWPLALIAAPAAVSIWSGWVGLGQLSGFGVIHPLPGIADTFRINTAITLPVGVEAYGAYALGAWLSLPADHPARAFARRSAIGSLVLGMLGQVAYHLLAAAHQTRAPWPVVVLVACLPVVTLGFGAALTHLLRSGPASEDPSADSRSAADIRAELAAVRAERLALESARLALPEAADVPEPEPEPEPKPEPEPLWSGVPEPDSIAPEPGAPVSEVYPAVPQPPAAPLTQTGADPLFSWLVTGSVPVPAPPAALNGHGHAAAEMFAADLAAGRVPGIRAIRSELSVGQDRAQAVQAYLREVAQAQRPDSSPEGGQE